MERTRTPGPSVVYTAPEITATISGATSPSTAGRAAGGVTAGRWFGRDRQLVAAGTLTAAVGFVALAGLRTPLVVVTFPILAMFAVSFPFGAIYTLASRAS
ncbi:MAG: hypothetical protein ACLFM5_07255, partial [Spirochaetaceae bacterium]